MPREIERRFLITELNPEFNSSTQNFYRIEQGYFEIPGQNSSFRVRIYDGAAKAEITLKTGAGMSREELNHSVAVPFARRLLNTCHHGIEKVRKERAGWEIDSFLPPLEGVVLAEFENDLLLNPEYKLELPEWVGKGIEVTDSLTNLHLARLATLLRGSDMPALNYVLGRIDKKIHKIVLDGPPCSGKTTVMNILKPEFGSRIHFVPEVATIIIAQVGIIPGSDKVSRTRFQKALYKVQTIFEYTSAETALDENKSAMLLDRALVSSAAYLDGGLPEYNRIFATHYTADYDKYHLVMCLGLPSRDVYEKEKLNNPARRESYEEAKELELRTYNAWKRHPNFVWIDNGTSWEDKVDKVRAAINSLLKNNTA